MSSTADSVKTNVAQHTGEAASAALRSAAFPASEASALLRDIEASAPHVHIATGTPEVRRDFLKKVYTILALQLALTTAVCAAFMVIPAVQAFVLRASALILIVSIVGSFMTLLSVAAHASSYPLNALLLFAFTLFESLLIGSVCALYAKAGLGYLIFEAVSITMLIFVAITVYVFLSKADFSFMGGALFAALFAFLGASAITFLFEATGNHSKWLSFLVSFGGSVLFSWFILYDTSLIINHFGPDDAIQAAIILYTDLLNLFLQILALLNEAERD